MVELRTDYGVCEFFRMVVMMTLSRPFDVPFWAFNGGSSVAPVSSEALL